jgi:hypothetical protein
MNKKRRIEEQLAMIEKRLADAEGYVAQGVNVEGSSWPHYGDWNGKSGHPLWMKNFMIPATKRARAKKVMALDRIRRNDKAKRLKQRRRAKDYS